MSELVTADRAHLWHPCPGGCLPGRPPVIARAEGAWLIDTDGNRILDGWSSGLAVLLGHGHPGVRAAAHAQLDRLDHASLEAVVHAPAAELARRLAELAPWGLSRVFFSDDRATAVEVALKIAFQRHQLVGQGRRVRFAVLESAWHGATLGALSLGDTEPHREVFEPLLFEPLVLPLDEQAALHALDAHRGVLAALVFEPLVQVESGAREVPTPLLRALCARARAHGALLVCDESATFGRTATRLAVAQVGLAPDLLCLARLGGGVAPLAATLATEAVRAAFVGPAGSGRDLLHATAFAGSPLGCAAALATLDALDGFDVARAARVLRVQLDALDLGAVRQCGLIAAVDVEDPHRLATAALERGVLVGVRGGSLLIAPPLCVTDEELVLLVRTLAEAADAT